MDADSLKFWVTPVSPGAGPASVSSVDLILELTRDLHVVGQPTHRLEALMSRVSETLGTPTQLFAMPTGIFLAFDGRGLPDGHPWTYLVRARPRGVDLSRMRRLSVLAHNLIEGRISPFEARNVLEVIRGSGTRWGASATVLAYVLSAGAFSVFFRGGPVELTVGVLVGLAVGLMAALTRWAKLPGRLFELMAAAVATLVAGLSDILFGTFVSWIPLAAGLIILLPGIAIVDALEELASGSLVSGVARMAGVGVVFLALIFGVVIGQSVADLFPHRPSTLELAPLPPWSVVPALFCVALGSTIRFKAEFREVVPILVASALSLGGARLGGAVVGELAGPFLGALTLGLAANLYARWPGRVPELMVVPGIWLLVPGSVGFRSMSALLSQDTAAGVDTAFRMFLIATALVAGLIFSNVLLGERE